MADEIRQTPEVIARQLTKGGRAIHTAAKAISRAMPLWVAIAARGTSDHAAVYARYLIEAVLGVPVVLVAPSINTVYESRRSWSDGLLISISQSGRSPDLLAVLEADRQRGRPIIAITNDTRSPLADGSHFVIDCLAGVEKSVAATKTYVGSLAAVAGLVEGLHPTDSLDTSALPEMAQRTLGSMGVRTRPCAKAPGSECDVWTVTTEPVSPPDQTLVLPIDVTDEISPIPMVLPGLILAETVARSLGYDPDAPRGLTKVTKTP